MGLVWVNLADPSPDLCIRCLHLGSGRNPPGIRIDEPIWACSRCLLRTQSPPRVYGLYVDPAGLAYSRDRSEADRRLGGEYGRPVAIQGRGWAWPAVM